MNNELIGLRNRAKKLAKSKGMSDCADDFAQEAYLALARGRKAQLRELWVDFLRGTFGDNRSLKSIKRIIQYEDVLPEVEFYSDSEEGVLWDSVLNNLSAEERLPIVLYFQWGLTLKEIGYTIGVSEGRVSQQMTAIMKNLKKRFK